MAELSDLDMLAEVSSDMGLPATISWPRERALLVLIYELNRENRELKLRVTELERQWRSIAKKY